MTQSGARNKGTSMKQKKKKWGRKKYVKDERIMVTRRQISMKKGCRNKG